MIAALKNPGSYESCSAFAPICNPVNCPWGEKCFGGYLGDDKEEWKKYDATELIKKYTGPALNIFIDQGSDDQFLKENQLLPNNFVEAANKAKVPLIYKLREGYDHSYFFISTFIGEHFEFHTKFLN